ncbi:hypothetical protein NUW54_g12979 [Trametes sanguinea]|uniref:Uncharacterized protein n=1 Tax=Trametes sanguinea TaxID=158606 RepID=A0ACC1MRZ4_9APHY|nr:hypothetical protein NUW54_g12979 [Trametes sanguinea]
MMLEASDDDDQADPDAQIHSSRDTIARVCLRSGDASSRPLALCGHDIGNKHLLEPHRVKCTSRHEPEGPIGTEDPGSRKSILQYHRRSPRRSVRPASPSESLVTTGTPPREQTAYYRYAVRATRRHSGAGSPAQNVRSMCSVPC